jgi:hypothetical protein
MSIIDEIAASKRQQVKLATVFFREAVEPPGAPRDRNKIGLLQSTHRGASNYCEDLALVEVCGSAFVTTGDELYPVQMTKRCTRAKAEPKVEAKK